MESAERPSFQTFASLSEAEAYSDKTGDAYYEMYYHLEGNLNLCIKTMHDLYADAPPNKRLRMQTGVVRDMICPKGWPKHGKTLVYAWITCARFRHEKTCHAYTINEAMVAFLLEKEHEGALHKTAFDRLTFEPMTQQDAESAREDLLRLSDWIESTLHFGIHTAWYGAPDCFSEDQEKAHLANIGIAQRHLAKFPERDQKRWGGHPRTRGGEASSRPENVGRCREGPTRSRTPDMDTSDS